MDFESFDIAVYKPAFEAWLSSQAFRTSGVTYGNVTLSNFRAGSVIADAETTVTSTSDGNPQSVSDSFQQNLQTQTVQVGSDLIQGSTVSTDSVVSYESPTGEIETTPVAQFSQQGAADFQAGPPPEDLVTTTTTTTTRGPDKSFPIPLPAVAVGSLIVVGLLAALL